MKNLNYGIIGNCTSAALVSWDGSIDWCCLPAFDSASVFARLLDKDIGGEFRMDVSPDYTTFQQYLQRTNVLVTTFSNGPDQFELIDFMPRYRNSSGQLHCPPEIIRYIRHISGTPVLRVLFNPRPSYGKYSVKTELETEFIKKRSSTRFHESVYLYSDLDLSLIENKQEIPITADHYLLLSYHQKLTDMSLDSIHLKLEKTKVYWLDWSSQSNRFSQYNEEILRSALVLKLLTFQKTGAIIAAVTTSLPEELGGTRNWDYRYCWLRDAGMIIAVMTKLNHYKEARRFLDFILGIIPYNSHFAYLNYN
ncbi:MAG: glycoside hydrolase family 15 protein [Desulfobacterium sp.]|nr:glycoside hydrolase family 15 protein [Desulfobacterium sp.]